MNSQAVVVAVSHVLHEHECAVLPGFGAFILRKNFGIANPFSGQIKPAAHSIFFNADIKEDDGFVANEIKEQFGYSFKQASQSLAEFAETIAGQTLNQGSFRMGDLGSFHRNPSGELFFLANANVNLSLQTYGLPHIQWQWKSQPMAETSSITRNTESLPLSKPIEELPEALPILETVDSSMKSEMIAEESTDQHHSDFTVSKRSQPLLWRAAASFAIISIGAGILMTVAQIWSVSSGQDLASLLPQDTQMQQEKTRTVAPLASEIVSIQEENTQDSTLSHSIDYGTGLEGIQGFYLAMKDMKGKYSVSGGSYITLDLANRECLLWQKLGIDACVVSVKRSSLNKVILGKFVDEQRASHFAESIKNMPTGTLSVSDVALDWK